MSQVESTRQDDAREHEIEAVSLFAVLAHAKRVNDFRKAAKTQAALERLGVRVRFGRKAVARG